MGCLTAMGVIWGSDHSSESLTHGESARMAPRRLDREGAEVVDEEEEGARVDECSSTARTTDTAQEFRQARDRPW